MVNGRSLRSSAVRWTAVAILVAAGLGVGTLVAAAYEHATPDGPVGTAAPVPTFTLGVVTPTPTPTAESVAARPRDSERFLVVGTGTASNVWWRGVSGSCGGVSPKIERSTDAGATWTDVTPLYRGVTQLASLDAFAQTEAEIVVGVGIDCEPQAMRTFTQGQFWEPYPDVLATSRFISLPDASAVQLPAGRVDAPCAESRGLRARGDLVALVCDGTAWDAVTGASWAALPAANAVAVGVDEEDVIVAHAADDCAGLAVTRYARADPALATSSCVTDLDPAAPTAIASSSDATVIWSADSLATIGR